MSIEVFIIYGGRPAKSEIADQCSAAKEQVGAS